MIFSTWNGNRIHTVRENSLKEKSFLAQLIQKSAAFASAISQTKAHKILDIQSHSTHI